MYLHAETKSDHRLYTAHIFLKRNSYIPLQKHHITGWTDTELLMYQVKQKLKPETEMFIFRKLQNWRFKRYFNWTRSENGCFHMKMGKGCMEKYLMTRSIVPVGQLEFQNVLRTKSEKPMPALFLMAMWMKNWYNCLVTKTFPRQSAATDVTGWQRRINWQKPIVSSICNVCWQNCWQSTI